MSITRPNGRQVDEIVEAAQNLDQVWGQCIAAEAAPHFTCAEVDSLARLFRAVGLSKLAASVIEAHEDTDEEDDVHYDPNRTKR